MRILASSPIWLALVFIVSAPLLSPRLASGDQAVTSEAEARTLAETEFLRVVEANPDEKIRIDSIEMVMETAEYWAFVIEGFYNEETYIRLGGGHWFVRVYKETGVVKITGGQ